MPSAVLVRPDINRRGPTGVSLVCGTELRIHARRPKMRAMSISTPQMRMLARAVEDSGGHTELAGVLRVSVEDLTRWLSGEVALPVGLYVRVLDLVAAGR